MAKYDPLNRYLRRQSAEEVVLTFAEIENLLVALLPKSARRREWWGNEVSSVSSHVQARAWMTAGYLAHPAIDRDRVTFRRAT
ncbi:MAG TPA: hypothetical protein DIV82_03815 [Brevundimonas diminuta]|nr:hypothetical protein [Brevundimonas diminuta]